MTDLKEKIARCIDETPDPRSWVPPGTPVPSQRDTLTDAILDAIRDSVKPLEWKNDHPASYGYPDYADLPDGTGKYTRWSIGGEEFFQHSSWPEKRGRKGSADQYHRAQILAAMGVE